jgi:hypothetical protein
VERKSFSANGENASKDAEIFVLAEQTSATRAFKGRERRIYLALDMTARNDRFRFLNGRDILFGVVDRRAHGTILKKSNMVKAIANHRTRSAQASSKTAQSPDDLVIFSTVKGN